MLVLSRRINERIRLMHPDGTEMWIHVNSIQEGKVRLALEAPDYVRIERSELIGREPNQR